jgi:hypothetical protein
MKVTKVKKDHGYAFDPPLNPRWPEWKKLEWWTACLEVFCGPAATEGEYYVQFGHHTKVFDNYHMLRNMMVAFEMGVKEARRQTADFVTGKPQGEGEVG